MGAAFREEMSSAAGAGSSLQKPLASDGSGLRAPLLETFASIQGEGLYAGEPQVFLRFAGCPLRCSYCDTPHSWSFPDESTNSSGEFVSPFGAACAVAEAETQASDQVAVSPSAPRTVSLTGGEPLAHADFLIALAALLGSRRVHLETSGLDPAALERLLPVCDHVSLDLKLNGDLRPPSARAGLPSPSTESAWSDIRCRNLALLCGHDAALKLILTEDTPEAQWCAALEEIGELAPDLPVYIQPATPFARAKAPLPESVALARETALGLGLRTRVLPQLHPTFGWR